MVQCNEPPAFVSPIVQSCGLFPKLFRIFAFVLLRLQFVVNALLIFFVRYAAPLVTALQNLDFCLSGFDQLVYCSWEQIFALEWVAWHFIFEEIIKACLELIDHAGGKPPEVHGNQRVGRKNIPCFSVILRVSDAFWPSHDFGSFRYSFEESILIHFANASGHVSIFRDRIFQLVARHAVRVLFPILMACQIFIHAYEPARSIIVIGVDDRKRSID